MNRENSSSPTTETADTAWPPGQSPATLLSSPKCTDRPRLLLRALAVLPLLILSLVGYRTWNQTRLAGRLSLARQLLADFQPEAALDVLNNVLEQNPSCAEAEFLSGCACRRAGMIDAVGPHLRRAGELGWDADQIDRQTHLTYFQVGDFRRAGVEVIERMQDGASDDEAQETYEAMARGYTSAMLLKQAAFILEAWLEWQPESMRARLMLADVAALRGDLEGEMACYRDALKHDAASVAARWRLARGLLLNNELDEAYVHLSACRQQAPRDADVLMTLADYYDRRGDREQAGNVLATLLETEPGARQRSSAWGLLGKIALAEKRYDEAITVLEKAVEANPANLPAMYSLSHALSHAGRRKDAEVYLERWRSAQASEQQLDDLQSQILARPDDPDLRAQVAQSLMEQGAERIAVNWLMSVLFYHPAHPLANSLLADYFEREGDAATAARHRSIAAGDRAAAQEAGSSEPSATPGAERQPEGVR